MLIEAVENPIRYRWPKGKIDLIPGHPVDVSVERGAKILKKCGAKVRTVQPQWVQAWQELGHITVGIEKSDPRFLTIFDLLEVCDRCFENDDWPAFQRSVATVKAIISRKP